MTRTQWIWWGVLAVVWGLLAGYYFGHREPKLCPPPSNVVMRINQQGGIQETGTVYLNFPQAQQARDGIDTWMHRYGKCS